MNLSLWWLAIQLRVPVDLFPSFEVRAASIEGQAPLQHLFDDAVIISS